MSDDLLIVEFVVPGKARTAGSKRTGVAYRKGPGGKKVPVTRPDGSIVTFVKDDTGEAGENWRRDVRDAAKAALGDEWVLEEGALRLEITIFKPRPSTHFGSNNKQPYLKDSSPDYPQTKPDATKLARAIEDALTAIVWKDDSQIVESHHYKKFGTPERAEVRISRMPASAERLEHAQPPERANQNQEQLLV